MTSSKKSKKRYLLVSSEERLTGEDRRILAQYTKEKQVKTVMIPVTGRDDILIMKTDIDGARVMRESIGDVILGGKRLQTVIMSGCIGKLKKLAAQTSERDGDVKVSE